MGDKNPNKPAQKKKPVVKPAAPAPAKTQAPPAAPAKKPKQ